MIKMIQANYNPNNNKLSPWEKEERNKINKFVGKYLLWGGVVIASYMGVKAVSTRLPTEENKFEFAKYDKRINQLETEVNKLEKTYSLEQNKNTNLRRQKNNLEKELRKVQ
ncbi:hypothetical protein K9M74_00885 [Candidatus Woesearchaeota archaeon]|nr:hypothetical protein [Candidatus Woesearchaeota archaeon]